MRLIALAALLAAMAGAASAQQWFSLSGRDASPGATVVEVDLDTVHLRDGAADAVIRVTHDVLQPHPGGYGYRSFIATAAIDCVQRRITLVSAAYYALPGGQGVRVGADSSGRDAGMTAHAAERIPAQARQALLRAACPAGTP